MSRESLLKEALLSFGGSAKMESLLEYMREREPRITQEELERLIDRDPDFMKVGNRVIYMD
ncbi:hypothetical protein IPA_03415 [Ignicoccus pacificus DSM 13166]|uniref:Uncharacterized protein n=1 Tax=Ignicoccus pacificus DSM 13166 TaxID=940294 RepID=A0A977KB20_9CREN|nr:hypothetical protein IPA_03415 [Ignicoccus pacificus DSM 13166]